MAYLMDIICHHKLEVMKYYANEFIKICRYNIPGLFIFTVHSSKKKIRNETNCSVLWLQYRVQS